jgi:hypothetical protein
VPGVEDFGGERADDQARSSLNQVVCGWACGGRAPAFFSEKVVAAPVSHTVRLSAMRCRSNPLVGLAHQIGQVVHEDGGEEDGGVAGGRDCEVAHEVSSGT